MALDQGGYGGGASYVPDRFEQTDPLAAAMQYEMAREQAVRTQQAAQPAIDPRQALYQQAAPPPAIPQLRTATPSPYVRAEDRSIVPQQYYNARPGPIEYQAPAPGPQPVRSGGRPAPAPYRAPTPTTGGRAPGKMAPAQRTPSGPIPWPRPYIPAILQDYDRAYLDRWSPGQGYPDQGFIKQGDFQDFVPETPWDQTALGAVRQQMFPGGMPEGAPAEWWQYMPLEARSPAQEMSDYMGLGLSTAHLPQVPAKDLLRILGGKTDDAAAAQYILDLHAQNQELDDLARAAFQADDASPYVKQVQDALRQRGYDPIGWPDLPSATGEMNNLAKLQMPARKILWDTSLKNDPKTLIGELLHEFYAGEMSRVVPEAIRRGHHAIPNIWDNTMTYYSDQYIQHPEQYYEMLKNTAAGMGK